MLKATPLFIVGCVAVAGLMGVVAGKNADERRAQETLVQSKILLTRPLLGETLESPVFIEGRALTPDNSIIVRISDNKGGKIIEKTVSMAPPEKGRLGRFSKEVFLPPVSTTDLVAEVFWRAYFDGDERYKISVPFQLRSLKTNGLYVYFSLASPQGRSSCARVFPVTREAAATERLPEAAVATLFDGPTPEEKKEGYATRIPEVATVHSITIQEGTARVVVSDSFAARTLNTCDQVAARAQIVETLRQFQDIRSVVIQTQKEVGRLAR